MLFLRSSRCADSDGEAALVDRGRTRCSSTPQHKLPHPMTFIQPHAARPYILMPPSQPALLPARSTGARLGPRGRYLPHPRGRCADRGAAVQVRATGGGAFKYADLFRERLGVVLCKEDEMACLVDGCSFLLKAIRREAFEFQGGEYAFKSAATGMPPKHACMVHMHGHCCLLHPSWHRPGDVLHGLPRGQMPQRSCRNDRCMCGCGHDRA